MLPTLLPRSLLSLSTRRSCAASGLFCSQRQRCGCTTQAMGQYRSGKRPLPIHIAARVDLAFECHEMHDEMGRMEGRAS